MFAWLRHLLGRDASAEHIEPPAPLSQPLRCDDSWNIPRPVAAPSPIEAPVAPIIGDPPLVLPIQEARKRAPHRRAPGKPKNPRVRRLRATRTFRTKVAGVTFRNRDKSRRQDIVEQCSPGEAVLLVREPRNRHDPNAIAVCRAVDNQQIGYIAAHVTASLAADIDNKFAATGRIVEVTGGSGWDEDEGRPFALGVVIEVTLTDVDPVRVP
jgi:hypothetical protein